ncbi:precorrin-6A/cobalt-precorrin-6A reductase [Lentzea xinjiangensis]|uniref:Precorrin-6A/cobalt-precorrin-6A reductase n=1 Tax=Lentzea xinjiangensis TaxID=402600 RepID=A0A1H9PBI6_9PSEU|nr:cobalt-precorrin-6A reductase [Lentzea xinjiangensis]SER45531.1 precorrin-6A/cobalt-precorrin-6A reductase [Lentzea xinjiangensis]
MILLLGGTGEARELARRLAPRPVVSSLAGRVSDPALPVGEVRIGGFGGVDGLVRWLRDHDVRAVVDATHPFARQITANAFEACGRAGVPFLVLRRPGFPPQPGWHWVDSVARAARELPGSRVFLTTGRQDLAEFAGCPQWFLARMVEPPEPPLPQHIEVLLSRGPFTVDGELELMRSRSIDVLVTKDSGGEMTSAKLEAARRLGIPVVVVRRPPLPPADVVATVEEAVSWLGTAGV